MSDDLRDFFSEISKSKKEKKRKLEEAKNELKSIVGDLGLDSLFEDFTNIKKEQIKKEKQQSKKLEAFEDFFSNIEKPKPKKVVKKPIEEVIEKPAKEIVEKPIVTEKGIEEISEEELEKEIEEVKEDVSLIEKSLGLLATTDNNEDSSISLDKKFASFEEFQNHYVTLIQKIQQQLSTLGGGGEVNFKYLDDVTWNGSDDNGKFLKYNSTTEKFEFATVSGGGGGGETTSIIAGDNVTLAGGPTGIVTVGITTEQIQDVVGAMFTNNTETNITATYQDSDGTIDLVASGGGGGGGGISLSDLSVTTNSAGSAALAYNNSSGVFTYTPPDLSSYLITESDTLDSVLGRGNVSGIGLSVGVVTSTSFRGDLIGNVTGNTSGNAGTATSLATARTIGGVSFDGTSNINLPGVNAAGNQDTTGNADTATTAGIVTTAAQPNITSLGSLTELNVTGISTFTGGLFLDDNKEIKIGNSPTDPDLKIYHDGEHSFIKDAGTGQIKILTSTLTVKNVNDNKLAASFIPGNKCNLLFNNSSKLQTTNEGVLVLGISSATSFNGNGAALSGVVTSINAGDNVTLAGGPTGIVTVSANTLYTSYAKISDVKAFNVQGGTAPAGSINRDINTEDWDPDGIVLGLNGKALSGNLKSNGGNYTQSTNNQEFALGAGTYSVRATSPVHKVNRSHLRLMQVDTDVDRSNLTTIGGGPGVYAHSTADLTTTFVTLFVRFTLTETKILRVRQFCQTSSTQGYALGMQTNASFSPSVYTVVEIYKE